MGVLAAAAGFFATRVVAHRRTEAADADGAVVRMVSTTCCPLPDYRMMGDGMQEVPPDLRVFGVGIERPAQLATFVKESGLKFPVLVDIGSRLARSIDIRHFTSEYLVEDGAISKEWRGKTRDEAALQPDADLRAARPSKRQAGRELQGGFLPVAYRRPVGVRPVVRLKGNSY